VTQSYSGGVIEQTTDWKSFLLDKPYSFDQNFLLNEAQIDFSSTLGLFDEEEEERERESVCVCVCVCVCARE